ncbi:CoA-binding protein [Sodalis sp.]|uniref:CoA-binding protein n=1 Tax=Sodalis sp. (in: enterobacteria) TaxID=1898979 RepID=UPI0038737B8C
MPRKTVSEQTVYANLAADPYQNRHGGYLCRSDTVYDLTQEAIVTDADVLWLQFGIINEQAVVLARNVGIKAVLDRYPKVAILRLGLDHWVLPVAWRKPGVGPLASVAEG